MTSHTVSINTYKKSEQQNATEDYAKLEEKTRGDITKDVVLVSAGELKTLRQAYPNYFLDINEFTSHLSTIIDILGEKR